MDTCIRQFANKEQIKECREKINACDTSFKKLSNVLDLAGNEVRLKILYLLEEEKELCSWYEYTSYFTTPTKIER